MKIIKSLTFFCIFLFFVTELFSQTQYRKIALDDVWRKWIFYPQYIDGLRSMNDGQHYTVLEENAITKYNYATGSRVETIITGSDIGAKRISEYSFSDDESKLLVETDKYEIYRRSYTANYYVYDFKTKTTIPVSETGKQQLATFSPDGSKVAFVRENNLFIKDLNTKQEIQITHDGKYNQIINGAPDWVYEEELGFNKAFEWSPDGKNIAFMRFDETNVKQFSMTLFMGLAPKLDMNKTYPECKTFKYPKAGEENSVVTVWNYNLASKTSNKVDIGTETDIYIPRIRWTKNPDILCIFRMNRLQNKFELLFVNSVTGKSNVIYTETNKYYIDDAKFDNIVFLDDNKHFIQTSEIDGYRHLYLYDLNGKLVRQLTKGNWDITDYLGYDSKRKLFYYISAEESPLCRAVYTIDFEGKKKTKISSLKGTNKADFSKSFQYYINTYSSINIPPLITINDANGKQIRVIEDNQNLKERVKQFGNIQRELFSFKTSENIELHGYIVKPNNFDANKKYPVLISQYSGPNSQEVRDQWAWDYGWFEMLAQNGVIVVSVDPRGTACRGEEFRKLTYLNLGKYETVDMIETAKYLGNLSYVDASRIGIWGWSYGGFMVCSALTRGADYFKLGVAVAPVTNWKYYDNIYTERFMRTPKENQAGYDDNSPINHVDKYKGKLLIIHGSADDNVHLQNTMEFVEAMVQAGNNFDMMIYNNRNHNIIGGNTTMHLYRKITDFILNNL